jgi:N6-adenosine-specific RNA methylase IME4
LDFPKKKYQVIYADPPWRYSFSSTSNREIENHYPTMSLGDIMALKVPADDNCVLYMWATAPKLIEAIKVIDAWGFTYKTHAIWDKRKIGMGYWFRGQHELLMVGVKGKVSPPEQSLRISSVINEQRGIHSKKPDKVRDLISSWFPTSERIELFARDVVTGWDSWGNEIEGVQSGQS